MDRLLVQRVDRVGFWRTAACRAGCSSLMCRATTRCVMPRTDIGNRVKPLARWRFRSARRWKLRARKKSRPLLRHGRSIFPLVLVRYVREVECSAKGHGARKPYDFGGNVSITTTYKEGLVVGTRPSRASREHTGRGVGVGIALDRYQSGDSRRRAGLQGCRRRKDSPPGLRRGITRGLRAIHKVGWQTRSELAQTDVG